MTIDFKISPESFKKEYQESLPLIIKGGLRNTNISWNDINDIISRCDPQSENFRVSFPSGNIAKEKYVDTFFHVGDVRRRLNKSALYGYLRDGGTLVANHIYDEPVFNDLAKDIAQFTARQTVTSAYIAFGKTDSYRAHWDSRDVFAVQLKGRKRWVVHRPSYPAPLYMHQSKYLEQEFPCPDEPYLDFILEEGDVFYIPRGWWHNVTPLDEPTVHLAIGTFPAFAVDYVRWIFKQLPDSILARTALENHEQDRDIIKALSNHISELMNDRSRYEAFIESHTRDQVLETRLNLQTLGDAHVTKLTPNTKLRFNALRTDLADDYLVTSSGKFTFKDDLAELKNLLIERQVLTVAEVEASLPGQPAGHIAELLHQLATHGVVEIL
ncbi:JmjC domain-containing protein [Pseudomonas sp. COR18]|uniref:JmjC domain-containing protein n=1 Tax=Pseudomonas sp. COR18 TaxID=3399680 RepID=UPI003AFFDDEF